jgi:hypothetical protein
MRLRVSHSCAEKNTLSWVERVQLPHRRRYLSLCGVQTKRVINRAVLPAATPVHTPQALGGHVKVSRTACSSLLLQNDILHETETRGAIATAREKSS